MLVLENDAEFRRWKIEQRNATRVQRDRKSRAAVQQKLAQMRRSGGEGFELNRAEKLVSTQNEKTAPRTAPSQPPTNRSASQPESQPSRGVDLDFSSSSRGGGGGGGGAIDPVTALLSLGAAGSAALAHRRRKRNEA
jgi:MprA protease rhombosortase-interaction domain-containing protein